MLIAVLVLALFGLWTPIAVTLYCFRDLELERRIDESAKRSASMRHHPAGKHAANGTRYRCPVCGTEVVATISR